MVGFSLKKIGLKELKIRLTDTTQVDIIISEIRDFNLLQLGLFVKTDFLKTPTTGILIYVSRNYAKYPFIASDSDPL